MMPTMDFQDCMDDIDQAPVSVEKAVAAYGDGSDDENDDEDEEGGESGHKGWPVRGWRGTGCR